MFFKRSLRKKYREKLKKINLKYQKKLADEKNKIICILNHDIKTPLLAQSQGLKLLSGNKLGELNNEQKKMLNEILNSNNFLLDVVSNTIFLNNFENEKPPLKIENIDIVEQIQDCCSLVKNFALDKSQNIIFKSNPKNKIEIPCDKRLIQKIIFNILSSSVSFGFENSNIEINVKEDKKSISFYAKNKSIYMTKEKIKSLFEDKKNLCDFNQLGMSLNLNIAKKLINAHNWDIIARCSKDNSSTFGFVIKK